MYHTYVNQLCIYHIIHHIQGTCFPHNYIFILTIIIMITYDFFTWVIDYNVPYVSEYIDIQSEFSCIIVYRKKMTYYYNGFNLQKH